MIPFIIVVVVLGKGFRIMRIIAEKVDLFLPVDSVVGLPMIDLLAILFLFSCCFIAGFVAKSSWGRNIQNRIDDLLLQLVPGYAWIKGMTSSVSAEEAAGVFKPVWIRLDDQYQVAKGQFNAAYAAMITHLDTDVGRVMALLKELNLDESTLVMFSSDNGTTHLDQEVDYEFFESVGPLRGLKLVPRFTGMPNTE